MVVYTIFVLIPLLVTSTAGKIFARAPNGILRNCNLCAFAVMARFNTALKCTSVSETLVARLACRNAANRRVGVKSRRVRVRERTRFLFLLRLWNGLCYAARPNNNCLDFPFPTWICDLFANSMRKKKLSR